MNGVDQRRAGSGEACSSSSSVDDSAIAGSGDTDTAATALILSTATIDKPKVYPIKSSQVLFKSKPNRVFIHNFVHNQIQVHG